MSNNESLFFVNKMFLENDMSPLLLCGEGGGRVVPNMVAVQALRIQRCVIDMEATALWI